MRKAFRAGTFYQSDPRLLREEIENCFLSKIGPGAIKISHPKDIIASVVPHAGYVFSGPVAAHVYARLKDKPITTFIIAGPNHTGFGPGISIYPEGEWQLPFGTVEVNEEITEYFKERGYTLETSAHLYEHSVEVQIPFLQFIKEKFKIVPIVMMTQGYSESKELATVIHEIMEKFPEENIHFIASSDLNHIGGHFGIYPSAGKTLDEFAREWDEKLMNAITQMDSKELISLRDRGMSICGAGPVAVAIELAKLRGFKALKLYYNNSLHFMPSDSVVGYAAYIFEKEE